MDSKASPPSLRLAQLPRVAISPKPGSVPKTLPTVPASPSLPGNAGSPPDGLAATRSATTATVSAPAAQAAPSPPAPPLPPSSAYLVAPTASAVDAIDVDDDLAGTQYAPSDSTPGVSAAEDESMPQSPNDTSAAPTVDTRPTMADLLNQQETIRRDNAQVDAARRRVETPKPLACDIEAIERQYAAGGEWSFIATRIEQARPYVLPRAKYDMVIETGRAFAKTPLQKIMASLSDKHHGNNVLEKLYAEFAIGQVSKLPGGNLRFKVKTKEACLQLERTKVNILGGVFTFRAFDVLEGKYYIDISNVDSDTNTDVMLRRLFLLGCKPVYDTFREVNLATGITSATWRVYFLGTTCPSALIVNGAVCDQILFDNKLHPAHGKNAPFQSERMPFGYRSHHGIDLLTTDESFPRSMPQRDSGVRTPSTTSKPQPNPSAPTSYAQAATQAPRQTSLQRAIEEGKKSNGQLQPGAPHGQRHATTLVSKPISSVALSISSFDDSTAKITPPGSPRTTPNPVLLLTNNTDGFTEVSNKKKRSRNAVDFSTMLQKRQVHQTDGIATSNYFSALQSMKVTLEAKNVTADKKHGVRYQVAPVDVKRPDALKTLTESAFFVEKHHTKIKKAAKASPIIEVTESMLNDENTALFNTLPDCLAAADKKVAGVSKLIENATNPDHIIKKAVECPLAFNSALSLKMAGNSNEIFELAQLHAINRVLCATQPTEDTMFSTKWKKLMGTSVPSSRTAIFKTCAKWWTTTDAIFELSRASKALGMFELALMSIAPTLFSNDHWIQYLTGQPVEWIPGHHTRFLHLNTLLRLLRSELGEHCMRQWREVQWQGVLLDDLEALRKLDGFYSAESSVLYLEVGGNGEVTMVAGDLVTRC